MTLVLPDERGLAETESSPAQEPLRCHRAWATQGRRPEVAIPSSSFPPARAWQELEQEVEEEGRGGRRRRRRMDEEGEGE